MRTVKQVPVKGQLGVFEVPDELIVYKPFESLTALSGAEREDVEMAKDKKEQGEAEPQQVTPRIPDDLMGGILAQRVIVKRKERDEKETGQEHKDAKKELGEETARLLDLLDEAKSGQQRLFRAGAETAEGAEA